MIRISGVVLNPKKHIVIALRKIYGIGKISSFYICKEVKISPFLKVNELDDKTTSYIQKIISKFEVEGILRARVRINIKRLKDIKCYRGIRHISHLPVRGQKTKTNAKTRKRVKRK